MKQELLKVLLNKSNELNAFIQSKGEELNAFIENSETAANPHEKKILEWHKMYVESVKKMNEEFRLQTKLTPMVREKMEFLEENDWETGFKNWWDISNTETYLTRYLYCNLETNGASDKLRNRLSELDFELIYQNVMYVHADANASRFKSSNSAVVSYYWKNGILVQLERGRATIYYNLDCEILGNHPQLVLALGSFVESGESYSYSSIWLGNFGPAGSMVIPILQKLVESGGVLPKWVATPKSFSLTPFNVFCDWYHNDVPFSHVVDLSIYEKFPDHVREAIGENPFHEPMEFNWLVKSQNS